MIPAILIEKKRDGGELTRDEIGDFLGAYLEGGVEEYQMSAFLMAVVFRGMSPGELDALVDAMIGSGAVLDLSAVEGPRIDKHSTGGVGDKVSLVLAPLAAELGVRVPMMAGRGLGHTGGTLDKLEAIPGFRTDLDLGAFRRVLDAVGCVIIGQTDEIAPLDRRLYALRSVTGTVAAVPLIAASIMSKKLAEDLDGLLLDVKVGSGAFLPDEGQALELARTMVVIGEGRGVPTLALLTAMDRPLGRAIGNALEVREALDCLAGRGPAELRALVVTQVVEMARLGGVDIGPDRAVRALDDGSALARMARLIEAQGGDSRVVDEPERLGRAPVRRTVSAREAGVVRKVEPRGLGAGVVELGGGRTRLGQGIDPTVGFVLLTGPGDRVDQGDPLAEVHARSDDDARRGEAVVRASFRIGDEAAPFRPLVSHRIDAAGIAGSGQTGG